MVVHSTLRGNPEEEGKLLSAQLFKLVFDAVKTVFYEAVQNLFSKDTIIPIISSIIATLTGMLMSSVILVRKNIGWGLKFLGGVNLVATLYGLAYNIKTHYQEFTLEHIPSIVEYCESHFLNQNDLIIPNADGDQTPDLVELIKNVLTGFVVVVLAGFGLVKSEGKATTNIKDIFMTIKSLDTGTKCVQEHVEGLLAKFVGGKFDTLASERKHLEDLLNQAQALTRHPIGAYVSDTSLTRTLVETIAEINKALATCKPPDLNNLKQALSSLLRELNLIYQEVELQPTRRCVTQGVFFLGNKGVGKSTLVEYLVEELAEALEYSPQIYDATVGRNFYQPYRNQDFGIVNEFNSTTDKDQFIVDATKIVSGDPFSFEGAHLNAKTGFNKMKCLFVTSNTRSPELGELKNHAIRPFWDRFFVFEVIDPLVQPRSGLNAHRKEDFSHLTFNLIAVDNDDFGPPRFETLERNLNIWDVHNILKCALVRHQVNFHKRIKTELPQKWEKLAAAILPPPAGTVASRFLGYEQVVEPNSDGRIFPILRLQGAPGTGKTTLANKFAKLWSRVMTDFSGNPIMTVQFSRTIKEFIPIRDKPCLYIFDDWVTSNMTEMEAHRYVSFMNSTHPSSLFIITTNYEIPSVRVRDDKYNFLLSRIQNLPYLAPYDLKAISHLYPGLFRRIGLDHTYRVDGIDHQLSDSVYNLVVTVNSSALYATQNGNQTIGSIFECFKQKYLKSQRDKYEILILNEQPEMQEEEVDFEVFAENLDVLFASLKTTVSTASLYLNPTSKAYIKVSPRVVDNFLKNSTTALNPRDFCMAEVYASDIPAYEQYKAIIERMARALQKYFPNPTFRVRIAESKQLVYCAGNIVYYYDETGLTKVTFERDHICVINGETRYYGLEDFANALTNPDVHDKFQGSLENISLQEYELILVQFRKQLKDGNITDGIKEILHLEGKMKVYKSSAYLSAILKARENKILMICLGVAVLITGSASLYLIARLIKRILKNKDEESQELHENAFANVGSTPPKRFMFKSAKCEDDDMGQNLANTEMMTEEQREEIYNTPAYDLTYANSENPKRKNQRKDVLIANSPGPKRGKNRGDCTLYANNFQAGTGKLVHEHVCRVCHCLFQHIHFVKKEEPEHPQFAHQCPNPECKEFYGRTATKINRHSAVLLQLDFPTTKGELSSPHGLTEELNLRFAVINPCLMKVLLAEMSEEQRKELVRFLNINYDKLDSTDWQVLVAQFPSLTDCFDAEMQPNMLKMQDMIHTEFNEIESFQVRLTKCYVRVIAGENHTYGIHVGDGYYLTVGHSLEKLSDPDDEEPYFPIIQDSGIRYPSLVVSLDRDMDLGLVYCSKLRNLPSARKYFIENSSDLPMEAFFLRMGPVISMVAGPLMYKPYQEFFEVVRGDEQRLFHPTTEILKIKQMAMDVRKTVKRGDCGFPLVGFVNGTLKILGIHNAYKNMNLIQAIHINTTRINQIIPDTLQSNSIQISPIVTCLIPVKNETGSLKVTMPMEYANAFDKALRPDPVFEPNSSMFSLGYNNLFRSFNPLKPRHVTHDLELENPRLQLPAATTLDYVTDFSLLETDKLGRASPLITQALKYGEQELSYDKDILEHAIELTRTYNISMYTREGPLRVLREFETLNGLREPFLSNVDINTSAGPYCKVWGRSLLKKDILDVEQENSCPVYRFRETDLARNVKNHYKTQRMLLERYFLPPCLISQDNAKVENILAEDARQGKVRLFNNIDLSTNMILKAFFGHWFAQCMKYNTEGYYCIGQNAYVDFTKLYERFSTKQGNIGNADFKRFDKKLPKVLIQAFCSIAASLMKHDERYNYDAIYMALSQSLIYAVHLLDGSIYTVSNGNESGTFVTTLLNCVSVHITFNYAFIKAWQKIPAYVSVLPELKHVTQHSELGILGDDETQIVSKNIPMTEELLKDCAGELGMMCTRAKGGAAKQQIDFCSRVLHWDEKERIVYPRLKWSSITGQLYWFSSLEINQIRENFKNALFEASFYPEAQYRSVQRDVLKVAAAFKIAPTTIPNMDYKLCRSRLRSMSYFDEEYQQISALAGRQFTIEEDFNLSNYLKTVLLNPIDKLDSSIIKRFDSGYKHSLIPIKDISFTTTEDSPRESGEPHEAQMATNTCNNPINKCLELCSKLGTARPEERYYRTGEDHRPSHTCSLIYQGRDFQGEGPSKVSAKTQAYGALREFLNDNMLMEVNACNEKIIEANSQFQKVSARFLALYIEDHIKTARNSSCGKSTVVLISRRPVPVCVEEINGFLCYFSEHARFVISPIIQSIPAKKIAACYERYNGIIWDPQEKELILDLCAQPTRAMLREFDEKDYSDDENLILYPNASNTGNLVGVTESDDPPAMPAISVMDSEKSMAPPLILNRSGPNNNWLHAGGITHNIMDLVYHQLVGCNKQITIDDSKAAGTILAQIPYSIVGNEFANNYMENFAILHSRQTGDWLIKITCPGNPGMQCSIGIGWVPKKLSGTTTTMDVVTRYSYFTKGVSEPWSQTIVMTDARRTDFYREVQRKSKYTGTEFDNDPHIVVFCETPAISVYTEKKSTYLTFFSKFCSIEDQLINPSIKPMVFADPQNSVKYNTTSGYTLNF